MKSLDSFQITVIGAGVIGLAVAEELAGRFPDVLVVEKNDRFGQETSSRNSEVIHAGIYYPAGLLKTFLCTQGNRLLYETCAKRNIPHQRIGKLIVATSDAEVQDLENLQARARENGVNDLVLLGKRQVNVLEPDVQAEAALFSPSTGIIDSHSLMRSFALNAEGRGALIAFRSRVTAIRADANAYEMEINEGEYRFRTRVLINCAGLHAHEMAALAGLDIDKLGYRLKYCKGDYFTISPAPALRHLVYPVPIKNNEALGIHATIDLNHRVRFGPDSEYVTELEYAVAEEKRDTFFQAIKRYLPHIKLADLQPDMSGIRPKLQGPGDPYRDFVIQEERENGCPGLINLIGIESPGLTSCLAIGRHVSSLVEQTLSSSR
jgi:L-2-hydroxyglutarate oxidase LhgO